MKKFRLIQTVFLISIVIIFSYPVYSQTLLIPKGASWKYLDDGSDQDTLWRQVDFNDSNWATGAAQFGFGEGDEATVLNYGTDRRNKYITYYFRHHFESDNPREFVSLLLKIKRDGGAVIYLNGVELARSNMPEGPINYQTLAASTVMGQDEKIFYEHFASANSLVYGDNVLAAEIHLDAKFSLDMSFDFEMSASTELPKIIKKGPYLIFPGNNEKMQILWQLKTKTMCAIEWGEDQLYSSGIAQTTEYGTDHQHTYTISGLIPGKKYYYRVIAEGDTANASFYAALDSSTINTNFFVYGDTRSDPASHNKVANGIVSTFTTDASFQTFTLFNGDYVDYGDQEIEWDQQFFDPQYTGIKKLLAYIPLQGAKGNHEQSGDLYKKYFPYPYIKSFYWSFDYGPAHFAIVDQYTSYNQGSEQLRWLESDLATSTKKWKFISLHEPGWSAGVHENNTVVQSNIQPLCEKYGVQIIFAGHNHYYARASVNGIEHITAGGGGAPLYAPDSSYPHVVTARQCYHFCTVQINDNILAYKAISSTGQVIDEFTIDLNAIHVASSAVSTTPDDIILYPTYPNPFNPGTTISFSLPKSCEVELTIYNITGQKIITLINEKLSTGQYRYYWDGNNLSGEAVASGIYLYYLSTLNFKGVGKMVLIR